MPQLPKPKETGKILIPADSDEGKGKPIPKTKDIVEDSGIEWETNTEEDPDSDW